MKPQDRDPMQEVAEHLAALVELLNNPAVSTQLGTSLTMEFGYAMASFRARFPHLMPGAQQALPIV